MQIIIRKISVAAKPPSSAEIEEMEDIGFGTNGSISGDKWIHGLQFALYDGDYPELDELEFKQLAYYGDCDFEFINRKPKLADTCANIFDGEDDGEHFRSLLRADIERSSDDYLWLVSGTFYKPMDFHSDYEGEWFSAGFVKSSYGTGTGEVPFEWQEDAADWNTFCGVHVSYRIASIDEKYIKTVKSEYGEEEELIDLQSYLASQDFQDVIGDDSNHNDAWEYTAYGISNLAGADESHGSDDDDSEYEDSESEDDED